MGWDTGEQRGKNWDNCKTINENKNIKYSINSLGRKKVRCVSRTKDQSEKTYVT